MRIIKKYTELDSLDIYTKNLALDLLKRGALTKNKECMQRLGDFYLRGKYVEKDSLKGQGLLNEVNK